MRNGRHKVTHFKPHSQQSGDHFNFDTSIIGVEASTNALLQRVKAEVHVDAQCEYTFKW